MFLYILIDAINTKIQITVPLNTGPDVIIFAHDYVGTWAENGLIIPFEYYLTDDKVDEYFERIINCFSYLYPEAIWGLPISFDNSALFYNTDLIEDPPRTVSGLVEAAIEFTDPNYGTHGKWGFGYLYDNPYFHTMWVQGFGGKIFEEIGTTVTGIPIFLPLFYTEPMIRATEYAYDEIYSAGICPESGFMSIDIVASFFNADNLMTAIGGQWFRGMIDSRIDYGVAELPIIDELNSRAVPFLTAKGMYLSANANDQDSAVEVIEFFTGVSMGKIFAEVGLLTPANIGAYDYPEVADDPLGQVFIEAAESAIPMPNIPEMDFY